MREIKRIDSFTNEINQIWKDNFPDWRFGQLMVNFMSWYGTDIFYLEEDKFLEIFNQFVKEIKNL